MNVNNAVLHNDSDTEDIPEKGWKYKNMDHLTDTCVSWLEAEDLIITSGPLKACCIEITGLS